MIRQRSEQRKNTIAAVNYSKCNVVIYSSFFLVLGMHCLVFLVWLPVRGGASVPGMIRIPMHEVRKVANSMPVSMSGIGVAMTATGSM
jgi:hypothetical protein